MLLWQNTRDDDAHRDYIFSFMDYDFFARVGRSVVSGALAAGKGVRVREAVRTSTYRTVPADVGI